MGACDAGMVLKGRTQEAQKKEFWAAVRRAQDVDGCGGYTGTIAGFDSLTFTGRVFNTEEELDAFLENKWKGAAYVYGVKVIKDSPTIIKWLAQINELNGLIWRSEDKKFIKSSYKKIDAIREKIKAARARKAEKSTKVQMMAGGWVGE